MEREDLPWLKAAELEQKVFVTGVGGLHFVLLNCRTEEASQFLSPRSYCKYLYFRRKRDKRGESQLTSVDHGHES